VLQIANTEFDTQLQFRGYSESRTSLLSRPDKVFIIARWLLLNQDSTTNSTTGLEFRDLTPKNFGKTSMIKNEHSPGFLRAPRELEIICITYIRSIIEAAFMQFLFKKKCTAGNQKRDGKLGPHNSTRKDHQEFLDFRYLPHSPFHPF